MLIIGIIIGAALSLIPLLLRLKHDSREREKERQMSLRRDVYLSAAEKIGQQLSYLTSFYLTKDPLPKGYEEAMTKIHIIGNNETVAAINEFQDHIVEAFCELIPKKDEIDFLQERVNFLTEGLKNDPQEIEKSIEEFQKIYDEKAQLTYELAGECHQKAQLAEELLTPVIVAIRKELNTPFDEEAYRAMMKISHNKWKKNVENYIASMKEKWTQGMQTLVKDAQKKVSESGQV